MLGFLAIAACCVPFALGAAGLLITRRLGDSGAQAERFWQKGAKPAGRAGR